MNESLRPIPSVAAMLLTMTSGAFSQITVDDSVTFTTSVNNSIIRPSPYTFRATGTFVPGFEGATIPGALAGFDPTFSDKLIFAFSSENPVSVNIITYGGVAMSPAFFGNNGARYTGIYYLDNPTVAGDLVVWFSGGSVNGMGGSLLAVSGTAAGFGAVNSANSSSVSITTTGSNSLVVASVAANGGTAPTVQGSLTQLFSGNVGSAVGATGYQTVASASTATPTFWLGEITAAVEFPAAGGASGSGDFRLEIAKDGAGFRFSWPSQAGKRYDLVSSTDPSTAPKSWAVYDDGSMTYGDIDATPPTNTLTSVAADGARRFFAVVAPSVETVRVFLVGGQSNADGRADPSGLPTTPVDLRQPQDDVDFYYKVEGRPPALTTLRPGLSETGGFGPSITLGRALADQLGDGSTTRIALIKYANGGTNLASQWVAGGDATTTGDGPEYVTFQQTVAAGMGVLAGAYPAATIEIEGMIWLQGESDIQGGATLWNAYQTNLENFLDDIAATYGASLPFIIVRLSDGQTALNATGLSVVRTAQQAVAESNPLTDWIDTDGFGMKSDNLHFDAAGQQSIGSAAATSLLNLLP